LRKFPKRRLARTGLLVGAVAVLLSACAEDKPLNTFEPRGPKAEAINNLALWIWPIMGVVFVLVVGGGIGLAIKNRVKPEDYDPDDLPEQVHGNPKLEWTWTAVPALILLAITIPTIVLIWDLEEKNEPGELDVMVIGNQWWWEYRYDIDGDGFFEDADGDGEIYGPNGEGGDLDDVEWPLDIALDDDDLAVPNQLVIPTGEQIDLVITSRDVIHSFWIPRLNGKRDAVPGRMNTWSIESPDVGEYTGWCTEFCGLSHAGMRMSVVALEPDDFAQWLADQSEPADIPSATGGEEEALAANGRALFQALCASCHIVNEDPNDPDGVAFTYAKDFTADELASGAAPDLTNFASRAVFAGATYSQYVEVDPDDDNLLEEVGGDGEGYLDLDGSLRFNDAALKRWIKDAPSQKAMDPDNSLGMPAFPQLSEQDLEALVAYLATLD